MAHAVQAMTDLDPEATILSIDGISVYDLISRRAMLPGLCRVDGGSQVLPFVKLFYGSPSQYWWEDDKGIVHEVDQGEGGEQGDAMMPLLFSVGQHDALSEVQNRLLPSEVLCAFLDDIYVVCRPERVGVVHTMLENALWRHARIQVHAGKTKIWNRAGVRPEACNFLERRARLVLEGARVWRGGLESETHDRGIKILGTPLGHPDYVAHQLQLTRRHQQTLLDRIPALPDVQSAWALLLHCGAARANCFLRVIPPQRSLRYAQDHDEALWNCLCGVLDVPADLCVASARAAASLPLAFGGLGMRSAVRTSTAAYWASWGDSLEMIAQRHPSVVDVVLRELNGLSISPHLSSASEVAVDLARLPGFVVPTWDEFVVGRRPPPRNIEDVEPGTHGGGWQHEAAARMEWDFRARMMATLAEPEQALLRSQSGTAAGTAFAVAPSHGLVRIESQLFRVLLLRRLRLPLPPPRAHADVAVCSTALATIVHHAHRQGFWEDVGLHWRAPWHAFVARPAAELQPTCSSETLTFLCHQTTDDGWR